MALVLPADVSASLYAALCVFPSRAKDELLSSGFRGKQIDIDFEVIIQSL